MRLSVREHDARGEGRPVVFVHSALADGASWDAVLALAPSGVRTIALDLADVAYDAPGTTPADLERGVRDYLAALPARSVTLVGHSLGGWVAARVLSDPPAAIRRAVIVSGVSHVPPEMAGGYRGLAAGIESRALDRRAVEEQVIAGALGEAASPALCAQLGAQLRAIPTERLVRTFRLVAAIGDTRVLPYDVPTTLLHGERDASAPLALGREIASANPRARLEVLDTASHMLIWTHAPAVARAAFAEPEPDPDPA